MFDYLKAPWFRHLYAPACLIFSLAPLTVMAEKMVSMVNTRLLQRLSYASFGMYLYHRFVFWVLLKIHKPTDDLMIVAYLFLLGLPLIYIMGQKVQTIYDLLLGRPGPFSVVDNGKVEGVVNG
jgi:surface polysaccharide O-acyltransferase-like enzyme